MEVQDASNVLMFLSKVARNVNDIVCAENASASGMCQESPVRDVS